MQYFIFLQYTLRLAPVRLLKKAISHEAVHRFSDKKIEPSGHVPLLRLRSAKKVSSIFSPFSGLTIRLITARLLTDRRRDEKTDSRGNYRPTKLTRREKIYQKSEIDGRR